MLIKKQPKIIIAGMILGSIVSLHVSARPPLPPMSNATGMYIEGLAGYNRHALDNTDFPNNTWKNGMGNGALGFGLGS